MYWKQQLAHCWILFLIVHVKPSFADFYFFAVRIYSIKPESTTYNSIAVIMMCNL